MPSAAYISLLTTRIIHKSTENSAYGSSVITDCKIDLCKAKIGCEYIAFPSGKRVSFVNFFGNSLLLGVRRATGNRLQSIPVTHSLQGRRPFQEWDLSILCIREKKLQRVFSQ